MQKVNFKMGATVDAKLYAKVDVIEIDAKVDAKQDTKPNANLDPKVDTKKDEK